MAAPDRPIDEANRFSQGLSKRQGGREERRCRRRRLTTFSIQSLNDGQGLVRDLVRGSDREGESDIFANRRARRRDMFSRTAIASAAYSARAFAPSSAAIRCRSRRASAAGLTSFPLMAVYIGTQLQNATHDAK